MTNDEIVKMMRMVAADAETDAAATVPFTPLGIGTTRGEILAMIAACATAIAALAENGVTA